LRSLRKTRDEVHDKWIRLPAQAKAGPVATEVPTLDDYLTLPVAALVLEWYLPLPRRWWSLLLFVATYWLRALVMYLGLRRLRRLARESKAGRASQGIVDPTG
jgi:hypothetical protein